MRGESLTMRLEGGIIVTFQSREQKQRFTKNHIYKGVFIHGFDEVKKCSNGYYYHGMKIPEKVARANIYRKIEETRI